MQGSSPMQKTRFVLGGAILVVALAAGLCASVPRAARTTLVHDGAPTQTATSTADYPFADEAPREDELDSEGGHLE